jgi:hypothetical protein
MGLSLSVGLLADLKVNDEEGFAHVREDFDRLNEFLATRGLPPHREPLDGADWSASMIGYSGLHDVRRIAAHLDAGKPLPPPAAGAGGSAKDPVVAAYWESATGAARPSFFKRLFGGAPTARRFDHLMLHSDAEGYYLPLDFAQVLFPPDSFQIPGGMIGSAPRLLDELERVARALEIPPTLEESEELDELVATPATSGPAWKRYGRETYGCVILRDGCRQAIATGAALVFT